VELLTLHRGLVERHGVDGVPTLLRLKRSRLWLNAVKFLRLKYGEKPVFVHARPIWYQDEERLLNCTGVDTAALQQRAMIRTLISTGCRASEMAQMVIDLDIEEIIDFDGPAVKLIVPPMKNLRQEKIVTVIREEAAYDLRQWLRRRRQIFPESSYLFVTNTGKKVTVECVNMWLNTLCIYAGYGARFFSAHSFRHGFASRVIAECLAKNEDMSAAFSKLSVCGLWAPMSPKIPLLRNFLVLL